MTDKGRKPNPARTKPQGAEARVQPRESLRQAVQRFDSVVAGVQDYAIFLLDPEGRVANWNAGAQNIKGYRSDEIIGQHFSVFYPPDALEESKPQHELEIATRTGHFEDEGWRVRKDGRLFWANVLLTALRDDRGTLIGFLKITRDLTEKRRSETALRESEERFRLLVESIQDYAIFTLDPEGHVTSWNAAAERIKGYRASDILGKHFSVFYPREALESGWPHQELAAARATGRFEDEGWRVRKDGSRFWANVIITALHDQQGELRGFSKITRDLTERKKAEERLLRAYAELEVRVEERTLELSNVNRTLQLEVAERQRLEGDLRRRVAELHDADRSKSEFLATLAHELRNPLAPLRNALQMMSLAGGDAQTIDQARDIMERQLSHMVRLVDDLVDVSRITRNKLVLRKQIVGVDVVVQSALETSRQLIESRGHELTVELPAQRILVLADPTRLSQILANLLNNAGKFTNWGGHIRLSLEAQEDTLVARVRDDGIGISADLLPRIFDMFEQGDRSLERSHGGLGIGLTLVKQLVELHGGQVEATSEGLGRGSEFVVRLPIVVSKPQSEASEQADAERGAETRQRILVVDDNRDLVDSVCGILKQRGYQVQFAYAGNEAADKAEAFRPNVVLLDIGMPGMNGYEVASYIRAQKWGQSITLIAITGWGQEQDRERARESGFDIHLVKPVSPATLESILADLPKP